MAGSGRACTTSSIASDLQLLTDQSHSRPMNSSFDCQSFGITARSWAGWMHPMRSSGTHLPDTLSLALSSIEAFMEPSSDTLVGTSRQVWVTHSVVWRAAVARSPLLASWKLYWLILTFERWASSPGHFRLSLGRTNSHSYALPRNLQSLLRPRLFPMMRIPLGPHHRS